MKEHATGNNVRLTVMAVILGALIVVAGIQTVALVGLNKQVSDSVTELKPQKISIGGSSAAGSGDLQGLPQMVGGC